MLLVVTYLFINQFFHSVYINKIPRFITGKKLIFGIIRRIFVFNTWSLKDSAHAVGGRHALRKRHVVHALTMRQENVKCKKNVFFINLEFGISCIYTIFKIFLYTVWPKKKKTHFLVFLSLRSYVTKCFLVLRHFDTLGLLTFFYTLCLLTQ